MSPLELKNTLEIKFPLEEEQISQLIVSGVSASYCTVQVRLSISQLLLL
jgi:hypothetical protein